MLNYRSNGRRQFGRPLKRLVGEVKTGLLKSVKDYNANG